MNQDSDNTQARSQQMVDQEALSALMDNELGELELHRLLRSIKHRPDLLEVWERYNLARTALQSEPMRSPSYKLSRSEFSASVAASIASQPPLMSQSSVSQASAKVTDNTQATQLGVRQHLARFAVAASVTVAVFLGMQALLQDQGSSSMELAEHGNSAGVSASRQQIAIDADAQQRLNDYIRSVSIPARIEAQSAPFNVLLESPQLRPVSDRELIEQIDRD
jgi:negative regulator of sigma E activity